MSDPTAPRDGRSLSRRDVLLGAAAGAGLVALAGCSSDPALAPRAWDRSGSSAGAARPIHGTISGDLEADALEIEGGRTLRFDPSADTTLELRGNLLVRGRLEMKPRPGVRHTLRFVGVDETAFEGGGMDPLESDVGLWVVDDGTLDILGSRKRPWNRTGDADTWENGDELIVAPVAPGDYRPRPFAHGDAVPSSGERTAEVLNLTRNVRIEGTPGGRAHVFVRSTKPQRIRFAELRHLGPRRSTGEGSEGVLGRYPLHFHHSHHGSHGSLVEGVVVRDSGHHGFVPHRSHGITFRSCIAYEVFDEAYWWDPDEATHDVFFDRCVAASVHFDPEQDGYRLAGFLLGDGRGVRAHDCVAFSVMGARTSAGFVWPEAPSGLWDFRRNVAHNNLVAGIFVWQNNSGAHAVDAFTAYHNGENGIIHGAYSNAFHYRDLDLTDQVNAVALHAVARVDERGAPMSWDDVQGGGLWVGTHVVAPHQPVVFRRCSFPEGVTIDDAEREPGPLDFVDCGLQPGDFTLDSLHPGTVIRVQNAGGSPYELTAGGVRDIPAFHP